MSVAAGVRGVELARALWGAGLLLSPGKILRALGVEVDKRSVSTARVLGLRHLVQAGMSGIDPSRERLTLGVWTDSAHAATALALAMIDRARARAAVTDALVASAWAALGHRDVRRVGHA